MERFDAGTAPAPGLRRMEASAMQRMLMAVLPLLVFAAGGCDFFGHKDSYYTYCDATGCYTCNQTGCTPQGPPTGSGCQTNNDCGQGCYCAANGTCTEAGFCDKDSDCSGGNVCDVARASCEPV